MVAGFLFAPKRGEETRQDLKRYAKKTEEEALGKAKKARATLDETIDCGKHFFAEKAVDVEAAAKAARETMKDKMDSCCS